VAGANEQPWTFLFYLPAYRQVGVPQTNQVGCPSLGYPFTEPWHTIFSIAQAINGLRPCWLYCNADYHVTGEHDFMHDIRDIQDQLHIQGLSSLASSESHIHRQLQELQMRLGRKYLKKHLNPVTYDFGKRKMHERCRKLFGSKVSSTIPYLMVTFDTTFAEDYHLVEKLLKNGMNVCRINCAQDNESD